LTASGRLPGPTCPAADGQWRDGTRCVHAGLPAPAPGAPFLPGPVFASSFHLDAEHESAEPYDYGRVGNPGWQALEQAIGELDGGSCVLFPSGMAAIAATLRATLRPGDTLVLPLDGYHAVRDLVGGELAWARVRETPTAGPWPQDLFRGAQLVLVETPSNPGLDVCDIREISRRAHDAGALVAVDNTIATPLGQRPLELGADLTVASDTKALSGHSDLLLGHVTARDAGLIDALREARTLGGAIPGPFETWLAHRGLATLDLRLARQAENAAALAKALRGHLAVGSVRWPGLPDDPAHQLAAAQMIRFGGVLAFVLADREAVRAFLRRSRLVTAASSFGGLHTTADRRARWGDAVPPGFVRLSAGCEDAADLVDDVCQALDGLLAAT
jgi:cystathionine gamma-lyase